MNMFREKLRVVTQEYLNERVDVGIAPVWPSRDRLIS